MDHMILEIPELLLIFMTLDRALGLIIAKYSTATRVTFVDAHGRLGSLCSEFVGGVQAENEDARGEALRLHAYIHSVFAVNTFLPLGKHGAIPLAHFVALIINLLTWSFIAALWTVVLCKIYISHALSMTTAIFS